MMSDVQKKEGNRFVAYEYKRITARSDMENIWRDGLSNLGWTFEKREPAVVKHVWGPIRVMLAPLALIPGSPAARMICDHPSETKVDLLFKRDKDLPQKSELNRLQSSFESCTAAINHLEKSKSTTAVSLAYVVGLMGTFFMAGSVFGQLAGLLPLSIILAVPGFSGWIMPYFLHQVLKAKKTKKVTPLINEQYGRIYEVCAKANMLVQSEKVN